VSAEERTGWRDQELSLRHRHWGFNCPMVDVDFLAVEYDGGVPKVLVDYKHEQANEADPTHASMRALIALANRGVPHIPALPFMIVRYWPDIWAFEVVPMNEAARAAYPEGQRHLTEREYVLSLHALRGFDREWALNDVARLDLNAIPPPNKPAGPGLVKASAEPPAAPPVAGAA
jgi:hypothetical protein